MSTATIKAGSLIGAAAGGVIGGAPGALVGSASATLLTALLVNADVSGSEILAGLPGSALTQTAQLTAGWMKPQDLQEIRDVLQDAVVDAFRDAVFDIGGKYTFGKAWGERNLADPDGKAGYLFSPLVEHQKRPDLAEQVKACLQALHDSAPGLVGGSAAANWYLADGDARYDLQDAFHENVIRPWLLEWRELLDDLRKLKPIYHLEDHLRRQLFPRLLVHLGAHLQQRPEAWRAFNREMWKSVQMATHAGDPTPQLQSALKRLERLNQQETERLADLIITVGEMAQTHEKAAGQIAEDLQLRFDHLTGHISAEHEVTRGSIADAVAMILQHLPTADSALGETILRELTISYQEEVAAKHRLHQFQGIAQFRDSIRLPLADFYLELGLLPWQRSEEERERLAEMVSGDEEARLAAFEKRMEQRLEAGLGEFERLVVVGDPGAGKTMTLSYIALILAQGQGVQRLGLPAPLTPVLVRLADYAQSGTGQSLESFLPEYVLRDYAAVDRRLPEVLGWLLRHGHCMILLDGLDEIAEERGGGALTRDEVAARVRDFADRWVTEERPNRLVVTSRKEGYRRELLPDFRHVELSPLRPPDEVETFLVRWYTAYEQYHDPQLSAVVAADRARTTVDDMLPRILNWPSVRYLATNPLLLTVLVLVYENVGQIPDRRAKLYNICAQTLIQSWRAAQTKNSSPLLKHIGEVRLFAVLGRLAYWLHEHRPGGTASEAEWEEQLEQALREEPVAQGQDIEELVENFMAHARFEAGLLSERGPGQIGFFHLTLEEYLAGYAIAHAAPAEQHQMVAAHWEDPRWREPILLAVGELSVVMKSSAGTQDFINRLLDLEPDDDADRGRQVVLAGRALLDAGLENVPGRTAERILRELRETLQDVNSRTGRFRTHNHFQPRVRFAAGEVLDILGWLPEDLNRWIRCKACAESGTDLLVMKYPITNSQFELFINAGGYENAELWGEKDSKAWRWRVKQHAKYRGTGPIVQPEYWRDRRFGRDRRGFPVVGVSWYEAAAYARWLTTLLRLAQRGDSLPAAQIALVADLLSAGVSKVRLPKEEEWVCFAGGGKNNRYPWDRIGQATTLLETIIHRANVDESGIGQTSPVAMYPKGRQKENGLMDLAGNVWEWTSSWYDQDRVARVLRGGSWNHNRHTARVAEAKSDYLEPSNNTIGFRLVAAVDGSF